MIKKPILTVAQALVVGAFLLTACGGDQADLTPTLSADAIQTQAIETFGAALTQTAAAAPTDTPAPTLTPTFALLATSTAGTPLGVVSSPVVTSATSCYGLTFAKDVTILDNTAMTPGQSFTKTWQVLNSGSCAWDAGFKFALTSGDAMSGVTYTLPSAVGPGSVVDISVAMVAPNKTGSVRGTWRMSTAGGQPFGDGVFVVIVVGGATTTATGGAATGTATPTATTGAPATATSTPTATATPTP